MNVVDPWNHGLPPLAVGEDRTYALRCDGADPTGYGSFKFTLTPAAPTPAIVITAGITTSYDQVAGVGWIFVPLTSAQTSTLSAAPNGLPWQLVREDSGTVWRLAAGTVRVTQPSATIP